MTCQFTGSAGDTQMPQFHRAASRDCRRLGFKGLAQRKQSISSQKHEQPASPHSRRVEQPSSPHSFRREHRRKEQTFFQATNPWTGSVNNTEGAPTPTWLHLDQVGPLRHAGSSGDSCHCLTGFLQHH
ncbi:hypothetical protein SKAU_G00119640 [Synaphobranchus kaupii]|uniref:Uncharacterized protein n=1 Tax=Synaphobranchus kaupii TaxID=118154 RepID=A0A9Q1FNG5_SYNKA|nr:hypothetical protein SKAU_G00119640 [Synaphobranchus kaupii]